MKSSDKIYYTEDIIKKVSELGYDEELVRDFYYFYSNYLYKTLSEKDEVSYYIPNLGNIYLTLTGVNYFLEFNRSAIKKKFIDNHKKKKSKIDLYIKKLKEAGNKSIAYFDKPRNKKHIKNA